MFYVIIVNGNEVLLRFKQCRRLLLACCCRVDVDDNDEEKMGADCQTH